MLVAGGWSEFSDYLASTEALVHPGGTWGQVAALPAPAFGLTASTLGGVLYLAGGLDHDYRSLSRVLAWRAAGAWQEEDPGWSPAGHWAEVGSLATGRYNHATAVISYDFLAQYCNYYNKTYNSYNNFNSFNN